MPRRNYIDEQLFGRMERDGIPHAGLASDEEFLRRAYLDATGLLPEPQKVREFLESRDRDKRDKLIDSLIGTEEFAEQWAWLWSDLLQTHNAGFSYWFQRGLILDRPYNEMAGEILSSGRDEDAEQQSRPGRSPPNRFTCRPARWSRPTPTTTSSSTASTSWMRWRSGSAARSSASTWTASRAMTARGTWSR